MKIPVIITRELLVFPHTVTPILIARPFSLRAAREALSLDRKALFIPQKDSAKERPEDKNDVYEIGTIGRFIQYVNAPDGSIRAIIEGLERVSLKELYYEDELFRAEYQDSPVDTKVNEEVLQLSRMLREYYSDYSKQVHSIPDEVTLTILDQSNDPYVIANVLAAHLPINFEEKIEIYKIDNLKELLKKLISILIRELEFHRLKLEIEERVTQEIRKNQKQYFLQQQMKEIQKELGLEEENEFEALEKQIKESLMPEDVKKKALHELNKLRRTPSISPEATVIRNYLDWLINLPWGKYSKDNLDIKHARKVLDEDHFGLEEQKERILEYLAVLKLKGQIRGQVICFVGPPGVGKTSLARSIARALGRKFVRISLGGMRDEAEIRGHRRTYVGAMPGRIIQQIRRAGTQNPVFLLDEIDKVGADWRGDPQAALMEVLDPEINKYFQDNYLEVDFDLSKVLFITTANSLYGIPRPLLDRMEVIPIKGYLDFEKLHIARDYL
ncbi:MAG TPA: AAA family ATPase, partial [candidate division WOR-3 bacterium]|nr:AAA family ATPase [candidate division WOR-3 bacterium]